MSTLRRTDQKQHVRKGIKRSKSTYNHDDDNGDDMSENSDNKVNCTKRKIGSSSKIPKKKRRSFRLAKIRAQNGLLHNDIDDNETIMSAEFQELPMKNNLIKRRKKSVPDSKLVEILDNNLTIRNIFQAWMTHIMTLVKFKPNLEHGGSDSDDNQIDASFDMIQTTIKELPDRKFTHDKFDPADLPISAVHAAHGARLQQHQFYTIMTMIRSCDVFLRYLVRSDYSPCNISSLLDQLLHYIPTPTFRNLSEFVIINPILSSTSLTSTSLSTSSLTPLVSPIASTSSGCISSTLSLTSSVPLTVVSISKTSKRTIPYDINDHIKRVQEAQNVFNKLLTPEQQLMLDVDPRDWLCDIMALSPYNCSANNTSDMKIIYRYAQRLLLLMVWISNLESLTHALDKRRQHQQLTRLREKPIIDDIIRMHKLLCQEMIINRIYDETLLNDSIIFVPVNINIVTSTRNMRGSIVIKLPFRIQSFEQYDARNFPLPVIKASDFYRDGTNCLEEQHKWFTSAHRSYSEQNDMITKNNVVYMKIESLYGVKEIQHNSQLNKLDHVTTTMSSISDSIFLVQDMINKIKPDNVKNCYTEYNMECERLVKEIIKSDSMKENETESKVERKLESKVEGKLETVEKSKSKSKFNSDTPTLSHCVKNLLNVINDQDPTMYIDIHQRTKGMYSDMILSLGCLLDILDHLDVDSPNRYYAVKSPTLIYLPFDRMAKFSAACADKTNINYNNVTIDIKQSRKNDVDKNINHDDTYDVDPQLSSSDIGTPIRVDWSTLSDDEKYSCKFHLLKKDAKHTELCNMYSYISTHVNYTQGYERFDSKDLNIKFTLEIPEMVTILENHHKQFGNISLMDNQYLESLQLTLNYPIVLITIIKEYLGIKIIDPVDYVTVTISSS